MAVLRWGDGPCLAAVLAGLQSGALGYSGIWGGCTNALPSDVRGGHDLAHDGMGAHHRHRLMASHGPDLIRHGSLGRVPAGQLTRLDVAGGVTDVGGGPTGARTGVGEVAVDLDL